jgi:hypothetical protein
VAEQLHLRARDKLTGDELNAGKKPRREVNIPGPHLQAVFEENSSAK